MKKLFSVLILAMIFVGCSSDDDNNAAVNLEGNWKMTAAHSENAHDMNNDGNASTDVMAQTNCYANETMEFHANNTLTIKNSSYLDIEMELIVGTTNQFHYDITCEMENDVTMGTYTRNGNTVTIIAEGQTVVGNLSGSELTFTIANFLLFEVTNNQGTTYVTEDVTFTFTKQ